MTKRFTATAMTLAMALGVASYASAAVCDKTIRLTATPAGQAIRADGRARVRSAPKGLGTRQSFTAEISAAVPDGTTYTVSANGFTAGVITIVAGRGAMTVSNDAGMVLPAGVDPVCSIRSVVVTDGPGTAVLTGSF